MREGSSPLEAWAAGLFEGEGTVLLYKGWAKAALHMTDEDVVRSFHEVVGMGRVNGPFQGKGGRKPSWRWNADSYTKVARLFEMFRPYLGERRTLKFEEVLQMAAQPRRQDRVK